MSETQPRLHRLYRRSELTQFVGLRRTQIDELMKAGEFPRPVRLSDTGRAVAWLEADLIAWQARRLAKRENAETDRTDAELLQRVSVSKSKTRSSGTTINTREKKDD